MKICHGRVWPHFEQQREYAGAVAGWVENGTVLDNLFVAVSPGGVDGISMSGESDSLSETDFLNLEGVPADFGSLTVQYLFEGKTLYQETVRFGDSLQHIPTVENRDGMYWRWDLPEQEHIYTSLVVEGAWHAPRSTLAVEGDPPPFLVEGQFYDGQELQLLPLPLSDFSQTALAANTVWVAGYQGGLTARMLTDIDGTLYLVWENGEPVSAAYTRDGSYIVFEIPNGGSFFYTADKPDIRYTVDDIDLHTSVLILIPFVILFLIVMILITRKYRKETRQTGRRTAGSPGGKTTVHSGEENVH